MRAVKVFVLIFALALAFNGGQADEPSNPFVPMDITSIVTMNSYTYEVVSASITNNNIPGTTLDCSIGKKCMIDFAHASDAWLEVSVVFKALRAQEGNSAGLITTHCESSVDKLGTIEINHVRKAWSKADVAVG